MTQFVSKYVIRTVVFEDGERMPMLVSAVTGMPVYDACVYATTEVRPHSGSPATIEQALRGVQFLLSYADYRSIDLGKRFGTGQFLELHELDDLVKMAYKPMDGPRTCRDAFPAKQPTPKVIPLDRVRKRAPKVPAEPAVSISTVAIRLYYVHAYLSWMGHVAAGRACSNLEQKNHYMELLREFLARLRIRTPKARTSGNRLSMTPEERAELLRVIDPSSPDNPWSGEFVRDRNRLLTYWGMGTGIRRGELLGLRIKLIHFRRNMADIMRRPDDKRDPRKYQPNTKTRERSIGISEELAYLTHEHIVKYRSKIRAAQKHDFLFVAENGRPLSLSALTKIFRTLRQRHPAVGSKLSSHVLRHTWNEEFSEVADRAEMSPEDERRARNHAMGWAETSKSADYYLKRRTRRQSAAASVKIQQSVIGTPQEDKNRE